MGATSRFAIPYPEQADVPDVQAHLKALADSVDSNMNKIAAYGTSLPASPYDGQEAILVDSVTNPSYQWRFRYNAGNTTSYKWEFVGGPSARSDVFTTETTSATASADLATVQAITVARAGIYQYSIGCDVSSPALATLCFTQVIPGSSSNASANIPVAGYQVQLALDGIVTVAAATTVKQQFWVNTSSGSFGKRFFGLVPVCVS